MIYLDNAATTACSSDVVEAMLPFFRDQFANASSIDHLPGTAARRAVELAREQIAELVDAKPEDVIFTSGSTEANNLALSVAHRVVTSSVEHPSVLDTVKARARVDDVFVAVDRDGRVDISDLRERLSTGPSSLVSIIATNNETGIEQDVDALVAAASTADALLHLDATQSVGTRALRMRTQPGIDGVAISAHKIYGPKGVGALIAGRRLRRVLRPVLHGGGHEHGFRSGTLNVPAIVGFGVAALAATRRHVERRARLTALRDAFIEHLRADLSDDIVSTVSLDLTSPHVLSMRIPGVNGRALLGKLKDEIAFSLGSACATNKSEPSHVLLALGFDKRTIAETIRISFAADQSEAEVVRAAHSMAPAAQSLRAYSVSR